MWATPNLSIVLFFLSIDFPQNGVFAQRYRNSSIVVDFVVVVIVVVVIKMQKKGNMKWIVYVLIQMLSLPLTGSSRF